jgi:hypothetical protein
LRGALKTFVGTNNFQLIGPIVVSLIHERARDRLDHVARPR